MASLAIVFTLMLGAAAPDIQPSASETPVDHPWRVCPDQRNLDPAGYYPERAQRRGVTGAALVECRLPAGATKVSACTWVTETPPDYGFGEAAARLGCLYGRGKSTPPQADTQDRIVKLPINFKLPGGIAHGDHGARH